MYLYKVLLHWNIKILRIKAIKLISMYNIKRIFNFNYIAISKKYGVIIKEFYKYTSSAVIGECE